MRMRVWTCLFVVSLTLASGFASAAALKTGEVNAQAHWVVHVDCEAFRATSLGQMARSRMAALGIDEKLNDFALVFGFNPSKDLRDVTLYGQGTDQEKAVALIDGTFDAEKLLALVGMNPQHEAIPYGSLTLHRWIRPETRLSRWREALREHVGREALSRLVYGTLYDGHLITAGAGLPTVKQALDTLEGSGPDATGHFTTGGSVPDGTFFRVAADDPAQMLERHPRAVVLRQAESLSLAVGENKGQVFIDLTLIGRSPEAAQAIVSIWQGIAALGKLAGQDRPLAAQLADSVQLSCTGKVAHVHAEAPAELVFQVVQQRIAEKRQQLIGK